MFAQKILVLEDEKILTSNIRRNLQKLGYSVSEITKSSKKVIIKVAEAHPHLILIYISLGGEIDSVTIADIIQNKFHVSISISNRVFGI